MMKLYGGPRTRSRRCARAMTELGVEIEWLSQDSLGGLKSEAFLALYPAGKIPVLVDGDRVMAESLAINLYLARRFDNGLWPATDAGRYAAEQWSFWAATEAEHAAIGLLIERRLRPEEERRPERAAEHDETLAPRLKYLDAHLAANNGYLVEDKFTIADLNVAAVLEGIHAVGVDLAPYPAAKKWYEACIGREALKRTLARWKD